MSGPLVVPRPLTFLLSLLVALALALSMTAVPASAAGTPERSVQSLAVGQDAADPGATDDDATTQTPAPGEESAAALAPDDFEVEYIGPECWDSSYNVSVWTHLDTEGLRLALQEEIDGAWVTLRTERFYEGEAFIYSDFMEEGETATFQVVVYHREAPAEQSVLHGPLTVTGVSTEGCEDWGMPSLPEEQWTVAETGCETVTFTSHADQQVVVAWFGVDEEGDWVDEEEHYFFLAPGESLTVETHHSFIYWISVTGVGEDLEPIEDEFFFAGEGDVEVQQDCGPTPGEPAEPTEPAQPTEPGEPAQPTQPAQPGDDAHKVPGRVQTDGGANASTLAIGLGLMVLAGAALVRRIH